MDSEKGCTQRMAVKCSPGAEKKGVTFCLANKLKSKQQAMLPRNRRVTRTKDWGQLHRFGRPYFCPEFVLKIRKNEAKITRFGIIVGTKVSKKATIRNLIKRRLRAIVSNEKSVIKDGFDIIIITKQPAVSADFSGLKAEVLRLLKAAKALKP